MRIVIRAGGVGARLWPMSRLDNPKQFHSIAGQESMLGETYRRALSVVKNAQDIFVSVNINHLEQLRKVLPDLAETNIIVEYDSRNTGPAMGLETAWLLKLFSPDEIVASIPSDDYISDNQAYADLLNLSEDFIKGHPEYILTPAVRPAYPDTGYSYMKVGLELKVNGGQEAIYEVAGVAEKPEADYCRELIDSGVYYCHTGMYVWRLRTIAELFVKLRPAMYKICEQTVELTKSGAPAKAIRAQYAQTEKMTIEAAITGKAPRLAMSVSDRIGWSDLGKWHVIKRVLSGNRHDNFTKGAAVTNNAKDNLIINDGQNKIIVVNDVEGLVIVDTPDALFISSAERSAEVKECLDKLREQGMEKYL